MEKSRTILDKTYVFGYLLGSLRRLNPSVVPELHVIAGLKLKRYGTTVIGTRCSSTE
jgi:hypothetical protein